MTPKKHRSHPEVIVLVLAMAVVALVVLELQFSISKSLLALFAHDEPRRRPQPVVSTDFGKDATGKSLFNQSAEQTAEQGAELSGVSGAPGAAAVDSAFRSQVNVANLSPLGTNLTPVGADLSPRTGNSALLTPDQVRSGQEQFQPGQTPVRGGQEQFQSSQTPVRGGQGQFQPGQTPVRSGQEQFQPGQAPGCSGQTQAQPGQSMQSAQSHGQVSPVVGESAAQTADHASSMAAQHARLDSNLHPLGLSATTADAGSSPTASGRVSVAMTVHPPQAEHVQLPAMRPSSAAAGESEKPASEEAPRSIALLVPHGSPGSAPVPAGESALLPALTKLPVGLAGSRYVRDLALNGVSIAALCPHDDMVQAVILQKYGSIFAADRAVKLPTHALFERPAEARAFQKSLQLKRIYAEGYPVVLQKAALESFRAAEKEACAAHLKITPVGDIASLRSYEVTAMIWQRYLEKGLQFWVARHKLTAAQARAVLSSPPRKQLEAVLAIEKKGLFLHANHTISILNLAAPPGSSQHISGLALDIEEHKILRVRQIMNKHGWYQTVIRDFPHFLYLGRPSTALAKLGLTQIVNDGHQFWVPDIAVR